jgi:hypothetical protein
MNAATPGASPADNESASIAPHDAMPSSNATPAAALAATPAAMPAATLATTSTAALAATSAATSATTSATAKPDAANPRAFDTAKPRAFDAVPPPPFDATAFAPALAEFDEEGLTALGRVFQAQASTPAQSPAPAQVQPSHVEAIFPRVS